MAPDNQKHVASIFWFGGNFRINKQTVRAKATERLSHDNLFHTMLGLLEIETAVYNPKLDMAKEAMVDHEKSSSFPRVASQEVPAPLEADNRGIAKGSHE
jgi:glucan phosphoethanolaminetransferase (alkaline phosphatase superfamily)